jgi:lysophospholipase L1-like esterase
VKNWIYSLLLLVITIPVALGAAELVLRIKNNSMTNYDIEMWRYARDLKIHSANPAIDFDHRHSTSALLQSVNMRLNDWGLRGGPVEPVLPGGRRILFLGGSITLGWGVPEDKTVEARLEKMLRDSGQKVQVLNGGVGNYNTERYVSRFMTELTGLNPTDIVVQYFLRDAEDLEPGRTSFVLRNSELAVTLWIAYSRLFGQTGEKSLVEHYQNAYKPDAPGFKVAQAKLKELADYAKARHIRLYFVMTPDVHNLVHYEFGFIHEMMDKIATEDGYTVVDLLPAFLGRPPQELWAMPGDPHPNALGHELMADTIFPVIKNPEPANAGN